MKKLIIGALAAVAIFAILAMTFGERALMGWRASTTEKTDLASLKTLLEPNIIIRKPKGDGPFPVVLQIHGCAGARLPHQDHWAKPALDAGYMAITVDSHRPRGLSRDQALQTVCAGKTLLGQERAGDILAAIDLVLQRDDVDKNNIILTGWSHGAWTIMDFMTMDMHATLPASLRDYESQRPSIKAAILFYPYCGLGTRTRFTNWRQKPDVLALIAGADSVVDHQQCLKILDGLEQDGVNIDRTLYPDTEHAFDDPFIENEYSAWHSPENMRDAMGKYAAFLAAHK